ncbi:MAG: P1 family peptidase [Bryobacterales bacterium]|nr:P1 family peptidase [Bryobacterales bacterium]
MAGLTDIPGIRVGHATDRKGLTGCTVILCGEGAVGGVDARGSATGGEEIDTLSPGHITDRVHAIVLAGGSAFGLEAASGVRRYLEAQGIGYPTRAARVPIVPAAILYDLGIGDAKARPSREMGEAAAKAAYAGSVEEGAVGAGTGATVGKLLGMLQAMKSGLGTATVRLSGGYDGVLVSALVAVNAVGDVRDPATGRIVAGARRNADSLEFADGEAMLKQGLRAARADAGLRENTTLAVVATNARLSKQQATKLAQLAQLGMARTIYPVNLTTDGDTVFALSLGAEQADVDTLGVAAAEAVSASILRAVRLAPTLGGLPGLAAR